MNSLRGQLKKGVPMTSHTSWKVGGTAKQCYQPADQEDLSHFLRQLPDHEPLLWLGLGSNTLISDKGFPGTVIFTKGRLNRIQPLEKQRLRVEAGVASPALARFCAHQGLQGLEFLAGIPGTLGGALAMNAGAHGHAIWDFVVSVKTINREGKCIIRSREEYTIGYRSVEKKPEEWFVEAELLLRDGNTDNSFNRIREILTHRTLTQPNHPSAGSVFRNPPDTYAGLLIERCGLKGTQIGDAIISEKHANFIINQGQARSDHIEKLIQLSSDTVLQEYGIQLYPEVCIY